ncbi:MAG: AAA family ATPase [Bifidobacteriaceae bacterium]|jgi:DNA helicase IV|nr:AAA family ATPase [Bifidobacteriaceae bacterium]
MSLKQSPIAAEQSYLDRLYQRLDFLREETRKRLAEVRASRAGGSPQNRSERDAFAALHSSRLAQLESVEDRLVFGALTMDDSERFHIGRIGLQDESHQPILTDWRAPAAEPFYQATAAHRLGVARRRHITTTGRRVTAIDDELLDLEAARGGTNPGLDLTGDGALMAALAAGRTGRMGDIVATIQAEQDRIIRSDLAQPLVVQGGPGTGKTAVALHRAAYLLYAKRERLASSGVLIVGPSNIFLHYIDRVLPSLGETNVVATTMSSLLPGFEAAGVEAPEVAAIKGRLIMAEVVRRAVEERQRLPRRDLRLSVLGRVLVLYRDDAVRARSAARATGLPYNQARVIFAENLLDSLARQLADQLAQPDLSDGRGLLEPQDFAEIRQDLRASSDVRIAINLCWMPMTPDRLLEGLYTQPHILEYCAPELSPAERDALARPAGSAWTSADVPLLDEAAELLGEDGSAAQAERRAAALRRQQDLHYAQQTLAEGFGGGLITAEQLADRFSSAGSSLTPAERAASDRTWTYGHIVVDEAQELSPMDWRCLLRRCPTRSLTIVGDAGQTRAPGAVGSWRVSLDQALGVGSWRLEQLTVNYRTPETIMRAAQSMARAAGLPVSNDLAARDVPNALVERCVADPVAEAVAVAAAHLPRGETGRVALIAVGDDLARLRELLAAGQLRTMVAPARENPLDFPLSVLDPASVKGLEFDEVILVDPDAIRDAAGSATDFARRSGAADLYVAMTRPTRRLWLLRRS